MFSPVPATPPPRRASPRRHPARQTRRAVSIVSMLGFTAAAFGMAVSGATAGSATTPASGAAAPNPVGAAASAAPGAGEVTMPSNYAATAGDVTTTPPAVTRTYAS